MAADEKGGMRSKASASGLVKWCLFRSAFGLGFLPPATINCHVCVSKSDGVCADRSAFTSCPASQSGNKKSCPLQPSCCAALKATRSRPPVFACVPLARLLLLPSPSRFLPLFHFTVVRDCSSILCLPCFLRSLAFCAWSLSVWRTREK